MKVQPEIDALFARLGKSAFVRESRADLANLPMAYEAGNPILQRLNDRIYKTLVAGRGASPGASNELPSAAGDSLTAEDWELVQAVPAMWKKSASWRRAQSPPRITVVSWPNHNVNCS